MYFFCSFNINFLNFNSKDWSNHKRPLSIELGPLGLFWKLKHYFQLLQLYICFWDISRTLELICRILTSLFKASLLKLCYFSYKALLLSLCETVQFSFSWSSWLLSFFLHSWLSPSPSGLFIFFAPLARILIDGRWVFFSSHLTFNEYVQRSFGSILKGLQFFQTTQ